MRRFIRRLLGFARREDGPTGVEYAVMLALIVVVCAASVKALGKDSRRDFRKVSRTIKKANAVHH
jgi:pilus assembly protein Flp/PilA